ncbi:histidinol phosphate phosphatase [Paracoccus sp. YIM 132242]|uniref:Histidinol phosphate phosphatase n=1 Tax=Paracoccus lichenicola TaxID=2665644 RepID=A0A6L6HKN2_9RHOB|nr:inositol monophosphatase family protein [Paracoccus lichenicola]MTD98809.1 histidinol phosphate phosphatase [Paracoccus lichenicola]
MVDLQQATRFASQTADAARKIAMRHFRQPLGVEHKNDNSPVTVADREIEAFIRTRIAAEWPGHGIFGEEEAPVNTDSRHVWIVDPIDGTKSFVTGHPLFGQLLALMDGATPCLGQIDMPATGERWVGVQGSPTLLNGALCRTSNCRDLSQAFAYTTDPLLFTGPRAAAFQALRQAVRLIRFGGDCYSYGLLASGHCDLVLETGLQPYDYLPVVQIVRGAGGVITDWHGADLGVGSAGDVLASATPDLHGAMLRKLADLRERQAA